MHNWPHQLRALLNDHNRVVMVTVAQTKGSTPREMGARFFVMPLITVDTIGGGNLEYKATQIARKVLTNTDKQKTMLKHFSLSAGLGMCCGGVVELLFELMDQGDYPWLEQWINCYENQSKDILITQINNKNSSKRIYGEQEFLQKTDDLPDQIINTAALLSAENNNTFIKTKTDVYYLETIEKKCNYLYLFGAGHVGQAIVTLMKDLPWQIKWVDTRDDYLEPQFLRQLSRQVDVCITNTPEAEIVHAKSQSFFLVMTHEHSLDLVLCEQILNRDDVKFFGMIGSKTKRQRFEHRLSAIGFNPYQLNKMICPIGIEGINSKQAPIIALSVVAQLQQQADMSANINSIKETA